VRVAFEAAGRFVWIELVAMQPDIGLAEYDGTLQRLADSLEIFPEPAGTAHTVIQRSTPEQSGLATSIGKIYGTRDPKTCVPSAQRVDGPLTVERARESFLCSQEHEVGGYLYLIENLTLQVGKGHPPGDEMSYEADLDWDSLVFPIRGSFTQYQCKPLNADRAFGGMFYNVGTNCSAYDQPHANGKCFKTSFGEWRCELIDNLANFNWGRHNVPPPPVR
jgi:hypothetical protein